MTNVMKDADTGTDKKKVGAKDKAPEKKKPVGPKDKASDKPKKGKAAKINVRADRKEKTPFLPLDEYPSKTYDNVDLRNRKLRKDGSGIVEFWSKYKDHITKVVKEGEWAHIDSEGKVVMHVCGKCKTPPSLENRVRGLCKSCDYNLVEDLNATEEFGNNVSAGIGS